LNATDSDCSASCGNGVVEQGETCDPPSSCPQPGDCDDGVACTKDVYVGSAANCNAHCRYTKITECSSISDRCCPAGCDFDSDPDCAVVASCGNGVLDPGETCDNSAPGYECPVNCGVDDVCTIATLVGNSADCTAECVVANITECSAGDGCCPELCAASGAERAALDLDCCSGSPCPSTLDF